MVDLELALELAHAEVRWLREGVKTAELRTEIAENAADVARIDTARWAARCDEMVADSFTYTHFHDGIRESMALLTEALPDIRRRSASRAARIDVHLERLRRLLP